MNTKHFVLLLLCGLLFVSCNVERDNSLADYDFEEPASEFAENRLAVNESYSVLVKQWFEHGELIKLDYEIVSRMESDRTMALDLRSRHATVNDFRVMHFAVSTGNQPPEMIVGPTTDHEPDFGCNCKSIKEDKVNDCIRREYANLKYCDGNFCEACSLEVRFRSSFGEYETFTSSVIILPSNFKMQY